MKYDKSYVKILHLAAILCLSKLNIFPLLGFFFNLDCNFWGLTEMHCGKKKSL